jgi:hypothetical protein
VLGRFGLVVRRRALTLMVVMVTDTVLLALLERDRVNQMPLRVFIVSMQPADK